MCRRRQSLPQPTSVCSDTLAPTQPSILAVTATAQTSISLFWSPSFDNAGVAGYNVYANGTKAGYSYHPHARQDYGQELGLHGNTLASPRSPTMGSSIHSTRSATAA
jgi:hypothetical protein